MTATIFASVLVAALAHALWNALLKHKLEPLLAVTLISLGCGVAAAPIALYGGLPSAEALPWLALSLVIHFCYYIALAEAYRHGDLGQIYPIARGTAPLMTAMGALALFGERMSITGIAGILALASGVLLLSMRGGRPGSLFNAKAAGFALLTAVTICAYTLVDAAGGRAGPSPWPYIGWLITLEGVVMLAFGLWRWPWRTLRDAVRDNPGVTFVGGALSTGSYAIAIWAMSIAPVGLVAALREVECSVCRRHRHRAAARTRDPLAHDRGPDRRRRHGAYSAGLSANTKTDVAASPVTIIYCISRMKSVPLPVSSDGA